MPSRDRKKEREEKKKRKRKKEIKNYQVSLQVEFCNDGWRANSVLMPRKGDEHTHTERERVDAGRRITRGILPTMQLESIPLDRDDHNGSVTSSTWHGAPGL